MLSLRNAVLMVALGLAGALADHMLVQAAEISGSPPSSRWACVFWSRVQMTHVMNPKTVQRMLEAFECAER
jgi:hypothetical protein